jgi:hypothetical protein
VSARGVVTVARARPQHKENQAAWERRGKPKLALGNVDGRVQWSAGLERAVADPRLILQVQERARAMAEGELEEEEEEEEEEERDDGQGEGAGDGWADIESRPPEPSSILPTSEMWPL